MPDLIFNIYFALVIFGGLSSFLAGSYVFLKDPFSKINRIFFLASLSCGIFAGGEAMGIWQGIIPHLPENYLFWSRINVSGGWFGPSLFIFLVLAIFQREDLFKNKIFLAYLWIPVLTFVGLLLFTSQYLYITEDGRVAQRFFSTILSSVYGISLLLLFLYFSYKEYKQVKSVFRKKQLKYLYYGLAFPVLVATGWFAVAPFVPEEYQADFFKTNGIAASLGIGMVIVSVGILKYGTFLIRGRILEVLFERLAGLVIVTDKSGRIILINDLGSQGLGYQKKEIIDRFLSDLIKDGEKKYKEISQELTRPDTILTKTLIFFNRERKEIPFLITFSSAKNEIILVGKNIEEMVEFEKRLEKEIKKKTGDLEESKTVLEIKVKARTSELEELAKGLDEKAKQRTKELQERVNELEKFQRLAVGRELKMIALKKEIKGLEMELAKYRKNI